MTDRTRKVPDSPAAPLEHNIAITMVLSPETEQRLNLLASQTGRAAELLLREIVERGIDNV